MIKLRSIGVAGVAGAALLLGGCVVAPPGYQAYNEYGQPAYVPSAALVVPAPAVSIGIGGGYYGGGYRRGGYGGYGYRGGRGYWR